MARLYEQQEQQGQQNREEQPQQQQEHQEEQQPQNRRKQPGWGTNRLIVAGFIAVLAIILLTALALLVAKALIEEKNQLQRANEELVAKSLSIADQRAEECLQMYGNVTIISTRLYRTMKGQLKDRGDKIDSLKASTQDLQRMLDEEIREKTQGRELVQKKDHELQILVEEKNQLQRANEGLKESIQTLNNEFSDERNEFNDERKKLENRISKCDREKQQMKPKEYGTIPTVGVLGAILVIGVVGVASCGILGGKK